MGERGVVCLYDSLFFKRNSMMEKKKSLNGILTVLIGPVFSTSMAC